MNSSISNQLLEDDLNLLKIMIEDEEKTSYLYQATNYWKVYSKRLLPELENLGLYNFRSRKNSVLSSFGATDLFPDSIGTQFMLKKIPVRIKTYLIEKYKQSNLFLNKRRKKLMEYYYFCERFGSEVGAKSISSFSSSLIGNPEDYVIVNKKIYTQSFFNYYLQYAQCNRIVNFNDIKVFAELGPGSGKQIELLKTLYPNITFLLFDITPQIYVCEQYLRSIFPNDVISYNECRNVNDSFVLKPGNIYIFGAWQIPLLKKIDVDIFWNSASMQEMEPEIVANYLDIAKASSRYIYLREVIFGKEKCEKEGEFGVLRPVDLCNYFNGLSGFNLIFFSPAISVGFSDLSFDSYCDMIWEKSSLIN